MSESLLELRLGRLRRKPDGQMAAQFKPLERSCFSAFEKILGSQNISADSADLISTARDLWPLTTLEMQEGVIRSRPSAVIWPTGTDTLAKVMEFADAEGIKLVPYGGGSGVCGGALALDGTVAVDMKRMRSLGEIDEASMVVDADAGIMGEMMERELNARGYTLGHFPSSIYCSTLGGWLATRSGGQLSTRYGKIEDMAMSLTVSLPGGKVIKTPCVPRSATGPDWNQVFIGSEGTLGIISKATMKLRPLPEERAFMSFAFDGVKSGTAAIRKTLQAGISPAVVRLYDPVDTLFSGWGGSKKKHKTKPPRGSTKAHPWFEGLERLIPNFPRRLIPRLWMNPRRMNGFAASRAGKCKLIYMFEGPKGRVQIDAKNAKGILLSEGGQDKGEDLAKHWYETRYKVSYNLSPTFDLGLFADTMEVISTWDNLLDLYYNVRKAISDHALVMAHFSHAYPSGCSIYFSFASTAKGLEEKKRVYDRIWENGLEACVSSGGAISHHHGIGRLKARMLSKEYGEAINVFKALKKSADPNGILPDYFSGTEEKWV